MAHFLIVIVIALALASFAAAAETPVFLDSSQPIDARVEDLLKRLTPEEKIGLIHANSKFSTVGVPRLNIPTRWLSDGPHGVREEMNLHDWNNAGHTDDFVTWMPADTCLAATWNPELARLYGETIGEEARVRGKDIMLGPAVNIQRTPLCGRNFEYMGEDPFLTSKIAVNYIKGEQSRDVASCVKHFAMNNQEKDRGTINVEADDRALHEIYLPAFRAAVQEANALTVMGAYNKFRAQHCCENDLLLNKILKGEWGFKGLVMSDWNGAHDTRECALNGLDLEMGTEKKNYDDFYLAKPYLQGINSGEFPMSSLDDKVRRNLRVMFATKMFDRDGRFKGSINTKQHQQNARHVAEEGIVLLKNDQKLLPLKAENIHSIAVIGDNATRLQASGGQSSGIKAFYEISPLEGLVRRAGERVNITYSKGYHVPEHPRRSSSNPATTQDAGLIDRAVEAAKDADVAIVIGGLNHDEHYDTEGSDRLDMKLPYGQDELIARVVHANPRTIVVLVSGSAVEMPWIDNVRAVVQAWYSGMEGGNALAAILFGDVSPSGRLPFTFPRRLEDSPAHALHAYPGENGTVEYKEGILVGYRWFDTKKIVPLFPFGHGLSYTTFDYSDIELIQTGSGHPMLMAHCNITNTGDHDGSEVVELYVHDVQSSVPRPEQELKGFAKVTLKPGEKQTVQIPLPRSAFQFYDPQQKAWVAEAGDFEVRVGSSSRDIRQRTTFHLEHRMIDRDSTEKQP